MDELQVGIGISGHTDYFLLGEQLDDDQLSYLVRTRDFVDQEVLPGFGLGGAADDGSPRR